MKKSAAVKFVVIVALVCALTAVALIGFPFGIYNVKSFFSLLEYGLDMQGGVELVYEASALNEDDDMYYAVSATMEKQQARLRANGCVDAVLTQVDETQIRIEIPVMENIDEVIENLGQSGKLTFQLASGEVLLTGANVHYAVAGYLAETETPAVTLEFDEEGTEIFAQVTRDYQGQTLYIYLDDEAIAAPTLNGVIEDGVVSISGLPSIEEAERLAGLISSGELNTSLELVSQEELASEMTAKVVLFNTIVLLACLVLVCAYFVWRYRMGGVMGAVTALIHAIIVLVLMLTVEGTVFTMASFLALAATIAISLLWINAVLSELSDRKVKLAQLRNVYPEVKKSLAKGIYGINAALILFGAAMQMESVVAITTVGRIMIFCGVAGILCFMFVLGGFLRLGAGMCKGDVLCKAGGFNLAGKKVPAKFAWTILAAFIVAGVVGLFVWTDTARLQSNSAWLALAIFAIGIVIAAACAFIAGGKSKAIETAIAVAVDMIVSFAVCCIVGSLASSTFAIVFILGAVSMCIRVMDEHCIMGALLISIFASFAMFLCGAATMSALALCMGVSLLLTAIHAYAVDYSALEEKFARK